MDSVPKVETHRKNYNNKKVCVCVYILYMHRHRKLYCFSVVTCRRSTALNVNALLFHCLNSNENQGE